MQLKDTLERHFSRHITLIEEGLTEIGDDARLEEEQDYSDRLSKSTIWTCLTCTNRNSRDKMRC